MTTLKLLRKAVEVLGQLGNTATARIDAREWERWFLRQMKKPRRKSSKHKTRKEA
jgi:hypothetical protein